MKLKTLLVVCILSLCGILATSLGAQPLSARFNVPFDFVVAGKTLPAGAYAINLDADQSGMVKIQSADARKAVFALTHNGPIERGKNDATLVFHRYGDRYYLAEVTKGGIAAPALELPASKAETEASKLAAIQAETVTLVAMR